MDAKKILIIEDEKSISDIIKFNLTKEGFAAETAFDGQEGLDKALSQNPDLILLDIMLPIMDGFAVCRKIRERTYIPILFISARSSDDDKIIALNIGGDDYIQKPYSLGVLFAKVKAVLKRYRKTSPSFSDGRLTVDIAKRQLILHGEIKKLKALEFKLLAYLVENRDRVVGKRELFEKVWEDKFTGDGTLNVHIRRIREVIEPDANDPKYIVTVWGEGYRFDGGGK